MWWSFCFYFVLDGSQNVETRLQTFGMVIESSSTWTIYQMFRKLPISIIHLWLFTKSINKDMFHFVFVFLFFFQWQKSEKVLVWWFIYRAVLAIYFLTTWLISYFNAGRELESPEDTHKYWIFLTNWSYIAEAMYFILAFVIVVS